MKVYFENGLTVIDTGDPIGNSTNTSGRVGVAWHKDKQIYQARIRVNSVEYHLGQFKNIEDAIAIRKEAEKNKADGTFDEWHQSLYGTVKKRIKGSASK